VLDSELLRLERKKRPGKKKEKIWSSSTITIEQEKGFDQQFTEGEGRLTKEKKENVL